MDQCLERTGRPAGVRRAPQSMTIIRKSTAQRWMRFFRSSEKAGRRAGGAYASKMSVWVPVRAK